jgi:hypothetical protein
MTNNLPALLAELSEIAPDVCSKYASNAFEIGEYIFVWRVEQADLMARHKNDNHPYTGPPALDWLQGALQRTIEARGWDWDIIFTPNSDPRYTTRAKNKIAYNDNAAVALLTALIAALKSEGK